jgi:BASS family bile acid:Na+ symporter
MAGRAGSALAEWLAALGRHGTVAVALSILLGIALPPLGALIRPFFPETVFLLLCLAFLRVEPAALMGLNAATTLALLLACVAVTPLLAPALIAAFVGPAVTFSPLELGLRLVLMLAGAATAATAVRAVMGKPWVERQALRIDGLNVIVLFAFALALMGDVWANAIERPMLVLGILALATAITFGLSALTGLLFLRSGWRTALPLAHAAGSRNTGLMLAAAAGLVPELVWLYVALIQIPIYALPLLARPWLRKLPAG